MTSQFDLIISPRGHNCQAWDHPIAPLVAKLYGLDEE